ncbi:type VI secretion protein VasB-1 [Parashewanella spongiae]|uniref:Type VI secretion protein VasB-1 n=2 Tax=Parashewanella spongiae TaxID=342950 RepID=A0A3A6U152_9GAMM|nr:type VI secretion protein VasB-1 [Parashewanella spongiae]
MAQHDGIKPKVRFGSEILPAYYQSQVTNVQHSDRSGWTMLTGLPALSGNNGSIPRSMYKKALSSLFDLGDEASIDFFNGFNNRYYSLQCQAEIKHDLTSQMEEECFDWNSDAKSISSLLSNLSGMDQDIDSIPKSHFIQYTGIMGLKLTCPVTLQNMLTDYFQSTFEIEHSGLEYQPLTPCSLTSLGRAGQNNRLGCDALIGKNAALVGQKLKIKICPKDYQNYLKIHNDPNMVPAIEHMVRSYMGINFKFKLYMKVNSCYLPRIKLSSAADNDIKIGQTAWMDNSGMIQQFVEMPFSAN